MKITKRQLRRIIKEATASDLEARWWNAYVDSYGKEPSQREMENIHHQSPHKTEASIEQMNAGPYTSLGYTASPIHEDVAAPFGSGMQRAEIDKDQKELVGHT